MPTDNNPIPETRPDEENPASQKSTGLIQRSKLFIAGLVGVGLVGVGLAAFLLLKPTSNPGNQPDGTDQAGLTSSPTAATTQPVVAASPTIQPTATNAPAPTTQTVGTDRPGWKLAWSDEFNGLAGIPPNPAVWTHEIGDGSANGNKGWGNNELEYYTDSTQNSAHDGAGNLVITARQGPPDGNSRCYYGPCQYTSARLITANKVELTYGRIEARLKVPRGDGLWPAFWALGTNIGKVGWPQSGEIDIMENVARQPRRVYGTIHGPGYSGNSGFSKTKDLPQDLADDFHVFAIEWEPDKIVWLIDDVVYNTATPPSVAPHEWVFNQPFFLILNVAVGGNFGQAVGQNTTFPQTMIVDYVRQYQKVK